LNQTTSGNPITATGASVAFACVLAAAIFVLERHFGFNLGDGGFLWYGAQRTLAGDVPLRDFMSYDPGRYWLAAAYMSGVHDNGILALRAWLAIVEALGLSLLVLVVANGRVKPRFSELAALALLAACWMYPDHKMLDITLSIACVAVFAWLLNSPSPRRFFGAGLYVGLSAVIGRNHGVYGIVACVLALAYLCYGERSARPLKAGIPWGALGIAAGFSPMLVAFVVSPGLWGAFVQSVMLLVNSSETNLPLPVPWPWLVSFGNLASLEAVRETLIGFGFVLLPVFALAGIARLLVRRGNDAPVIGTVFAAAVITVIPYAHYAFSRADVGHLAHSIFPAMIGLMCWPAAAGRDRRWPTLILLVIAVITMAPLMPRIQAMREHDWQRVQVGHDMLVVPPKTAKSIALLQQIDHDNVGPNQTLLVAPLWPAAYAILGRIAPVWDIYGLFPRSAGFEAADIARLKTKSIGAVVLQDVAVDGRDELRFKNTHPLLQAYIDQHFDAVPLGGQDPSIQFFVPSKKPRAAP